MEALPLPFLHTHTLQGFFLYSSEPGGQLAIQESPLTLERSAVSDFPPDFICVYELIRSDVSFLVIDIYAIG